MKINQSNDVSIVIPIYYYDDALACIKKLDTQNYEGKHELILVCDNPQKELPKEFYTFKNVVISKHKTNFGLAKSYNDGISLAKYENILFFHEDCVPKKNNIVKNMLSKLHEGNDVVNAMLIVPNSMFDNLNFWGKMMLYRYMGRVTPAIGKATLFKKEVFNKIGLFDGETFRTSGEDCEFSIRMEKNQIKVDKVPDLVDHNHKVTNAGPISVIKKEMQMGEAHGAVKRKYPFKRIGMFDVEYRIATLLLGVLGILLGGWYQIAGLFLIIAPLSLIPTWQATKNLYETQWIIGSMAYLILGPIIYLIQTYSAIKSFLSGKQTT